MLIYAHIELTGLVGWIFMHNQTICAPPLNTTTHEPYLIPPPRDPPTHAQITQRIQYSVRTLCVLGKAKGCHVITLQAHNDLCACVYTYILYIYMYKHMYMYMNIYTYMYISSRAQFSVVFWVSLEKPNSV